jgi:hypothetical protein
LVDEQLRTLGIGTAAVGVALAILAIVALIASVRNVGRRFLWLGWVYIGLSIAVTGGELVILSGMARMTDTSTAIILLAPVALLAVTAMRLIRAATRAFRQATRPEGPGAEHHSSGIASSDKLLSRQAPTDEL